MSAAHLAVESIDSEVQECQAKFKAAKKQSQRKLFTDDYKRKKVLLDGAYTELKRAQEATVKSIDVQRQQINSYLESSKEDSDQGFTYYASIIFRINVRQKNQAFYWNNSDKKVRLAVSGMLLYIVALTSKRGLKVSLFI